MSLQVTLLFCLIAHLVHSEPYVRYYGRIPARGVVTVNTGLGLNGGLVAAQTLGLGQTANNRLTVAYRPAGPTIGYATLGSVLFGGAAVRPSYQTSANIAQNNVRPSLQVSTQNANNGNSNGMEVQQGGWQQGAGAVSAQGQRPAGGMTGQNGATGGVAGQHGATGSIAWQNGATGGMAGQNGGTGGMAWQNGANGGVAGQNGATGGMAWQSGANGGVAGQNGGTGGMAWQSGANGGVAGQNGATGGMAGQHGATGSIAWQSGATGGMAGQNGGTGGMAWQNGANGGVAGQNGATGGIAWQSGANGGVAGQNGATGGMAWQSGANGGVAGHNGATGSIAGQFGASGQIGASSSNGASWAEAPRPHSDWQSEFSSSMTGQSAANPNFNSLPGQSGGGSSQGMGQNFNVQGSFAGSMQAGLNINHQNAGSSSGVGIGTNGQSNWASQRPSQGVSGQTHGMQGRPSSGNLQINANGQLTASKDSSISVNAHSTIGATSSSGNSLNQASWTDAPRPSPVAGHNWQGSVSASTTGSSTGQNVNGQARPTGSMQAGIDIGQATQQNAGTASQTQVLPAMPSPNLQINANGQLTASKDTGLSVDAHASIGASTSGQNHQTNDHQGESVQGQTQQHDHPADDWWGLGQIDDHPQPVYVGVA
ncbi:Hypothetical protein NTJ_06226 [Nesidiocoris tenuis]|uniref:Uncharacterized protein n=1 Tax=Nesidiocoris tenuis TaxID=355587 RepID=A0ABN7AME8_9HEMI|nr:Hypothetical protein NTJ_06226 [Nesidiocoris tenuis]